MSLPATVGPPSRRQWDTLKAEAEMIAKTEFAPERYRGKPDAILACMLAGRELGIGPMSALREITIIDGQPSLSAALLTALVRRAGHSISGHSTPKEATVLGKRGDTGEELSVTFTWEEAEAVSWSAWEQTSSGRRRVVRKLTEKASWQSYPSDMLWARAVSRLCRRLFSDVLLGTVADRSPTDEVEPGPVVVEADSWIELGERSEEAGGGLEVEESPLGPSEEPPPSLEEREASPEERPLPPSRPPQEAASPFLWDRLQAVLEEVPTSTWLVRTLDQWIRELHGVMEGLGLWPADSMHLSLARRNAAHLGELRKADLVAFAREAHAAARARYDERPMARDEEV